MHVMCQNFAGFTSITVQPVARPITEGHDNDEYYGILGP